METTHISLTLNCEQRDVEASVFIGAQHTTLIVYGVALRTAHGQKTHSGYLWLQAQDEGHAYSARDVTEIGYSGMRGNGSGQRSQFRHIGFFPRA